MTANNNLEPNERIDPASITLDEAGRIVVLDQVLLGEITGAQSLGDDQSTDWNAGCSNTNCGNSCGGGSGGGGGTRG
jgi:hypothetical protein